MGIAVLRRIGTTLRSACWALAIAASMATPSGAQPAPSVTPASSENARDVLARIRPSLIQVEGFVGTNTARALHGSGFAVTGDGLFMTNYHVVAEQVQYPDKYRLRYRTPDGATGALTVLAVDVRHDLAIVRASDHRAAPVTLNDQLPRKGERAYSVGFPLDVGLTITEGVSNGKVADAFDARIHYSGAINGGMSGGPAFNTAGDVIGINVSGYRFEQLVSFLVPAEHAVALRDRAVTGETSPDRLKADVVAQLRAHSAKLLGAIDGPLVTQNSAGFELPAKIAPFVDCTASANPTIVQVVQTTRINCAAKAGLYVEQRQSRGDINYTHIIMTTDKLGTWRFAARLSAAAHPNWINGQRRDVGPFACRQNVVALKGFDANVTVCSRSHRKLTGLYDFTLTVTSLNVAKQGFSSDLTMVGLEYEPGMGFIRRYLEAIEWKPPQPKP